MPQYRVYFTGITKCYADCVVEADDEDHAIALGEKLLAAGKVNFEDADFPESEEVENVEYLGDD